MDNVFSSHPAIAYALIGLLLTLVGYLIRKSIDDNRKELEKVAEKAKEIEKDSSQKFDTMKDLVQKNHNEILFLIEGVNIKLATIQEQVIAQKNICAMVQEAKKKQ